MPLKKPLELKVKLATLDDLPTIMLIERESYPLDMQANEEKIRERIKTFPEGQFIVFLKNKPVAYSTNQILNFDPKEKAKTWLQYTNGGYIASTHEPKGNAFYFVSVGVRPNFRRMGIGSFVYDKRLEIASNLGLEYAFGNFRIQTFRENLKYVYGLDEREFLKLEDNKIKKIGMDYIKKIKCGIIKDPLIILFKRDFVVLDVVPWYMGDIESLHLGVVLYKKLR
jgi:ribosomal protein S18 acetylase RimI-like enzyme